MRNALSLARDLARRIGAVQQSQSYPSPFSLGELVLLLSSSPPFLPREGDLSHHNDVIPAQIKAKRIIITWCLSSTIKVLREVLSVVACLTFLNNSKSHRCIILALFTSFPWVSLREGSPLNGSNLWFPHEWRWIGGIPWRKISVAHQGRSRIIPGVVANRLYNGLRSP